MVVSFRLWSFGVFATGRGMPTGIIRISPKAAYRGSINSSGFVSELTNRERSGETRSVCA